MKSLVIAEKPSVARDIARVLHCSQKGNGTLEGKDYVVTWALGHLVTLADPEEYDKKYTKWELSTLPMMPEKMKLVVIRQTSKQYNAVKTQLYRKDIGEIIIATDAGREGELVARWILAKADCHKPIKRLWISSVTDKAIRDGFAHLKNGHDYDDLYRAAQARAEADWLVGITKITAADVNYAKEMGNVIKLIGIARNTSNGIEAGVYPMMIDKKHPLATVRDSFNAVFVHGDAVGDTMFYGRGAGELPTASAVVGDVMDVTRNIVWNCTGRIGWSAYKELPIKEFADVKNRFFIRMQVSNEPGVLAAIAKVFGDHKVSIERVIQEQAKAAKAELVIGTSAVKEYHLQDALEELKEMPIVSEISSIIREY